MWRSSVSSDAREGSTGPTAVPSIESGDRAPIGLRVQGRYRIVRELGTGAFGSVCLAEDESTGHQVAIRLLPRWLAAPPHAAQAALRRGRSIIAASAAHPGLVRVHEFGELETGRIFAAMEFVEGRRLSEILSGGEPLDISAAIRLALDLGGSVETLHNMGLVHGALRPCNVLVLEDGRVKLMDLELAGLRDARPTDGALVAKPLAEYLSPEQICRAPVTEKADIYSFAVILYGMLCGVPPFQAETRDAVLEKHLTEPPPPMPAGRPTTAAARARAQNPPPARAAPAAEGPPPTGAPSPGARRTPPPAPRPAPAAGRPAVAPSPAAKATPPSASPLAA